MDDLKFVGRGFTEDNDDGGDYYILTSEDDKFICYYILRQVSFISVLKENQSSTQTTREEGK